MGSASRVEGERFCNFSKSELGGPHAKDDIWADLREVKRWEDNFRGRARAKTWQEHASTCEEEERGWCIWSRVSKGAVIG